MNLSARCRALRIFCCYARTFFSRNATLRRQRLLVSFTRWCTKKWFLFSTSRTEQGITGYSSVLQTMAFAYPLLMVLILDCNSEKGTQVRSNIDCLICIRHLVRSRAQIDFFSQKTYSSSCLRIIF